MVWYAMIARINWFSYIGGFMDDSYGIYSYIHWRNMRCHVCTHTPKQWKVKQYSVWPESAICLLQVLLVSDLSEESWKKLPGSLLRPADHTGSPSSKLRDDLLRNIISYSSISEQHRRNETSCACGEWEGRGWVEYNYVCVCLELCWKKTSYTDGQPALLSTNVWIEVI